MLIKSRTHETTAKNGSYADGYNETIHKGLRAARYFSGFTTNTGSREENITKLRKALKEADAVVIGAGAGLSTSAGFTYSGERFDKWFSDFGKKYGIRDMYSGGFYPYPTKEEFWAYWARYIYINRYTDPPRPVYNELFKLICGKDYFVITTNVDHCFQKAGFNKKRLFYTQGDYGLFQSVNPENQLTYDNEEWVMKAMEAQGFVKNENGIFEPPADKKLRMKISSELIPVCADDGCEMTLNLRSDDTFVEDEGWHRAADAYSGFLHKYENGRVLFIECGVGSNTPVIIKYPFWQMTLENEQAVYACLNYGEAYAPDEISDRSICINGDTGDVFSRLG